MIITPKAPRQEPLALKINDEGFFDSFVPGGNRAAVDLLHEAVLRNKNELFFVFGPQHVGKSHLLNALFREIKDPSSNAFFVDLRLVKDISPLLLSVEPYPIIILDNIDAIAGDSDWELALFGLYNRWIDKGEGTFIASARTSADLIPFLRKDLNTRFENGVSLPLDFLDEKSCCEALQIRAKKRGFIIPEKVAAFLVKHSNRDMDSLVKILDRLDEASLSEQHELTVPFVKKVLSI